MSATDITDDNFDAEVLNSNGLVLVDFWSPDCSPCKQLAPVLDAISNDTNDVKIVKMDIYENPETPVKYGVRGTPTMILLKKGEVVSVKVGNKPRVELETWISQNI